MGKEKKDGLEVTFPRYYNGYVIMIGPGIAKINGCIRVFHTEQSARDFAPKVIQALERETNQIKDEEKAKGKGGAKKTKARTKKPEQAESEEGVDQDTIK